MALRIAENALLFRRDDGELVLEYRGKTYARREIVPFSVEGQQSNQRFMASDYVAAKMLSAFGEDWAWPEEAVEFVFPLAHARGHWKASNDPSEQA